jgi:hypothetical protein
MDRPAWFIGDGDRHRLDQAVQVAKRHPVWLNPIDKRARGGGGMGENDSAKDPA